MPPTRRRRFGRLIAFRSPNRVWATHRVGDRHRCLVPIDPTVRVERQLQTHPARSKKAREKVVGRRTDRFGDRRGPAVGPSTLAPQPLGVASRKADILKGDGWSITQTRDDFCQAFACDRGHRFGSLALFRFAVGIPALFSRGLRAIGFPSRSPTSVWRRLRGRVLHASVLRSRLHARLCGDLVAAEMVLA